MINRILFLFLLLVLNTSLLYGVGEEEYLKNKKELVVCINKSFLPYSSFDASGFTGITADFLKLAIKDLPLKLKIKVAKSQMDYFNMLKNRECDIKPFYPLEFPNIVPYIATNSYFSDSVSLVTKIEQPYIHNIHNIHSKKIVIVKGFKRFIEHIRHEYPMFKVEEVKDINTALSLVASGSAFGYIGTSLTSSFHIQKKFSTQLKIVNSFEHIKYGFGVLNTQVELLSILNKSISNITEVEKQKIFNKWISTTFEKKQDYTIFFQVIALLVFTLFFMFIFVLKQNKLKRKIYALNLSLERKVKSAIAKIENQNILLQESVDSIQDILDGTMEMIVLYDSNGLITDVNTSCVVVLGYTSKQEVIGLHILSFVPSHQLLIAKEAMQKDNVAPYELTIIKKDRTLVNTLTSSRYIIKNGIKLKMISIVNITELKQKDEQLLQQSKLAQMGDMISMIAHQWRQPLNAISASGINLSLLSSMGKLKGEKVEESSEFIQEQCQKMSGTIDTFMNFVKPSKESKLFKLSHGINEIMKIMAAQLEHHNIKVNILEMSENVEIVGHEDLLEQVIINILSNARDAFEEQNIDNKFINITIDTKNNVPIISIEDNAGGIPKTIADQIFNPYFTTKEQGKGTGIGLYMSMDIMKKSFNGDLIYRATQNGSCFTLVCAKESR